MVRQCAEQALQAAQLPSGQRSPEELRSLRNFVLGASRGELVHSAPSGRGTLFWNFGEAIQDDACQNLTLRSVSPGELLFQEGNKAEEIFIVLSGALQLQLLRDEADLGLEGGRPKPPVNEIVALEQTSGRSTRCDFALEEKSQSVASVATNHRTTLRLLRGRTEHTLPRIGTPESLVSPRAAASVFKPMESPRVVSPQRALRRDDRLLRPVAEVIQALAAAAIGDVAAAEPPSFQRQWQQFQDQVSVDATWTSPAPVRRVSAVAPHRGGQGMLNAGSKESMAVIEEDAQDKAAPAPVLSPPPAQRRPKVVISEEQCLAGSIVGAAACMAGRAHQWRARAGENCRLLVLNSKNLGRAIKKELKRRRSERQQMLLNALGGPLKMVEEEKLQNLAVVAKTLLYRHGEVLCQEGEHRSNASHAAKLLVLMLGEARCLRSEEKAQAAPKHRAGFPLGSRWMATMQSAGTLLPGHAVNAASILADEPEPFTVVIASAEVLVLMLPLSDLAKVMSSQLMEQLKAKTLERLAWRRSQLSSAAVQASEPSWAPSSRRKQVPVAKELARLDTVLHDRPEIVCQSPRQPPGVSYEEGRDMMTSSLSVRRPPQTIECPKVHPALIPHLKDARLKPRGWVPLASIRLEEETASSCTESVAVRTCDDWGLRRAPSKKQSLRRARSMRVSDGSDCPVDAEAGPSGLEALEDGAMSSSFGDFPCRPLGAALTGKRATGGALYRSQGTEGGLERSGTLPKAQMKAAEGNLRVASIEQFLQKGNQSWRGWGKLGRPRTLAKLELDDDHLSPVLPTL